MFKIKLNNESKYAVMIMMTSMMDSSFLTPEYAKNAEQCRYLCALSVLGGNSNTLFLIRLRDGRTTPGNRDQGQVEIADALQQAMERGLVGQQACQQRLILFQIR